MSHLPTLIADLALMKNGADLVSAPFLWYPVFEFLKTRWTHE